MIQAWSSYYLIILRDIFNISNVSNDYDIYNEI